MNKRIVIFVAMKNKWSNNFDERPHHLQPSQGKRIFHERKVNETQPVKSSAISCSSRTHAVINFAAYTAALTHNTFQLARQSFLLGDLDPICYRYIVP